jgi:hypothetical protein
MKYSLSKFELLLIIVIPVLTFGLNLFIRSSVYDSVIGLRNINNLVDERLLGIDYDGQSKGGFVFPSESEFSDLWNLIKNNSSYNLSTITPVAIARFAVKNTPSVDLPHGSATRTVFLIPSSVPISVVYDCANEDISSCHIKIIGIAEDFKVWINQTRSRFELNINLLISVLSIACGIVSILLRSKSNTI